ncbi:MAG: Fic family protein [Pseudomonadota bacterium]
MTAEYVWPDQEQVTAYLRRRMEAEGVTLQIARPDDLTAGFDRARTAADSEPDATPFRLAALMFEGIATRHALVDGNRRLAWLGAIVFLDLNGWYLDAPEIAAFEIGMAVIKRENTTDDLAVFFERYAIDDRAA